MSLATDDVSHDNLVSMKAEKEEAKYIQQRMEKKKSPSVVSLGFWKMLGVLLSAIVMLLACLLYLQWQSLSALERQMHENRAMLNRTSSDQVQAMNVKLQSYFENYAAQLKRAETQLLEYQKSYNEQQEKLKKDIEANLKQGLATLRLEQSQQATSAIGTSTIAKVNQLKAQVLEQQQSFSELRTQLQAFKVPTSNSPPNVNAQKIKANQDKRFKILERQIRELKLSIESDSQS